MSLEQLNLEFGDFRGQLKSFVLRMTASVEDAEDIVQDAYLKAQAKIDSFEERSSLKTWVFAIASNLARDLCVPRNAGQRMSPIFAKKLLSMIRISSRKQCEFGKLRPKVNSKSENI